MVGLPRRWAREMKLEQGTEVTITKVSSRSLLVTAEPVIAQGGREAVIEADAEDTLEAIFRKVVSLYILGYSRIVIEGSRGFFSNSKKLSLKDLIRRHLTGAEGVGERRDTLTVHVLLGYSELSVESALKKMLLTVDSLMNDTVQALKSGDMGLVEVSYERRDEVGRFGLYVLRQLNLSLNEGVMPDLRLENRDTLGYILVARMLERIAQHAGSLSKAVGDLKRPLVGPVFERIASMGEEVATLVDDALLSLFKRDHTGADELVERSRRFAEKETEMARSLNDGEGQGQYSIHVIMDMQRRIAEYAKEVAEVVLDMTVERTLQEREVAVPQVMLN